MNENQSLKKSINYLFNHLDFTSSSNENTRTRFLHVCIIICTIQGNTILICCFTVNTTFCSAHIRFFFTILFRIVIILVIIVFSIFLIIFLISLVSRTNLTSKISTLQTSRQSKQILYHRAFHPLWNKNVGCSTILVIQIIRTTSIHNNKSLSVLLIESLLTLQI